MDDFEDKMNGSAILTFPAWQEGLFAVMYVMNNNEATKKYGPVNAASDATFEVISIFLELIQTLPFLLPTYKIYPCDQDSTMGAGCILKTIGQFWLPAQGTDFETFFGIMLALSVITFFMGAVAFYAASTFHKKDVHFVWPMVFLRWTVKIMITTYFIAVLQSQMLVFSCPLLKDGYVTSGLECGSPKHAILMAVVAISLGITVCFGLVFGLLYNTQDITAKDPGASAHGRAQVLGYITRIIVPAAYVVSMSVKLDGDNSAAAFVSHAVAAIALFVYAVSRVVCAPQIVEWANAARTALSFVFLAICLTGFASDISGMTVGIVGLVGACIGLVLANYRKGQTIQWARHRLYTVKSKMSDAFSAHLIEALFEECQNIKPAGQGEMDADSDADSSVDVGAMAMDEPPQNFNVKDKAAVTMVRNMMWIETDIELLFRFFIEEWEAMSAEDRKAAKVVINEIFVQVFHTGMFREFAIMWYAVIAHELFNDYLTAKHFLKVAVESNKALDVCYVAYRLQKNMETARQAANFGSNNATGNRFNLVDLVTFQRFADTARKSHRKALTSVQQVFYRMMQSDLQAAHSNKDLNDDDEDEESNGLKVSTVEQQSHNALLQEAMLFVRQAETSYASLTKAFPKSEEARALYLQFMKDVLPEEAPVDLLDPSDHDQGNEKSDSSSSVGGLKNALSPKQEYVRDLRSKLASVVRFTTITMWLGLLLMGAMMLIIAGVGDSEENYLVNRTVENVDALNAIRTSWLGICKFSVEISHFIRVRDDDRIRLSQELPPKNSQLLTLLNSVQNMNVGAAPVTAGTPDIVADLRKSNTDHEKMSDGDLIGLQSDWNDQVQILRKEVKAGKSINLLSNDDELVKSNAIPRLVKVANSPTSQVLKKFHEKYRTDKAAGRSEWACKNCNMHDIYVTDTRGVLVGFDLESGNKMQVNTDYAVYNQVKKLEIGKNMGKASEDFDSDPVLKARYESWNVHALLRLYQGQRAFMKFFEGKKRTDSVLDLVHIERVQHSDNPEQKLITITVPIWSPQPPADPTKDKPIGYVTSEARVLTSDFLEEVLKIQDLVWDLVMEMLTTLAKDISKMVDEEVTKAAEQGDNLKMKAFTDDNINLTYYSGVTQADSGYPEDAKLRTDKAWGRTYQTVSFRTVVAEFSNAVVASTANLQTQTYDQLTKLPSYRFITEMCVRPPQSYSLEMTNLTTDFANEFIADRTIVLVSITCCVMLLNLLTCGAMNFMIGKRLADFERRDDNGLSIAYKLVQEIPIMSKKKLAKRFRKSLKALMNGPVSADGRRVSCLQTLRKDSFMKSASPVRKDSFLKSLTNEQMSPPTTESPKDQEFNPADDRTLQFADISRDEAQGGVRFGDSKVGIKEQRDDSNDGDHDVPSFENDVFDEDARSSEEVPVQPKKGGLKSNLKSNQRDANESESDSESSESNEKDDGKRRRDRDAKSSRKGREETPKGKSKGVSIAASHQEFEVKPASKSSSSLKRKNEDAYPSKSSAKGKGKSAAKQTEIVPKASDKTEGSQKSLTGSCCDALREFFIGWTHGYIRRWVVILWALLMVYSAGLLARVIMNFNEFGTFCEDLALAQQTHFYFRNACTRVMDTVTYERMPWRTDSGQKLREDFDESLGLAEDSLNKLIANKDAAKYGPRQQLLFHPTCMLGSGNCGSRTGWEAYKNPELMERGMYRAALVWLDHVKELRREYADTKLPQSYINSTHPPEFWFVRDSIAYDLAPGLFLLIQTYIDEAVEQLPETGALIWAVAGGGLASLVAVCIVCGILMQWQWSQIADALTALRLLPWEDVQNQTVLSMAKIADKENAEGDGDQEVIMQPGMMQGPGGMFIAQDQIGGGVYGSPVGQQVVYMTSPPSGGQMSRSGTARM